MVINGAFSDWAAVSSRTVLGPLLFLIYVNDLDSVIKYSTVKLFADDPFLCAPANTLKDCSLDPSKMISIPFFPKLVVGS